MKKAEVESKLTERLGRTWKVTELRAQLIAHEASRQQAATRERIAEQKVDEQRVKATNLGQFSSDLTRTCHFSNTRPFTSLTHIPVTSLYRDQRPTTRGTYPG